jgi:cytochrome c oxidase assembly protein subunit 11
LLKQKYPNKLILLLSFLLIIIFAISIFLSQKNNDKSGQVIKIKLITSVHKDLPFEFETEERDVLIVPGEVKTINYTVKNLSKKSMNGMATFQVYPTELKDFMTKLNCFCYEEQTLKGGEKERYSLVLLVDPKVTKNIKEAIIQFVFFKK